MIKVGSTVKVPHWSFAYPDYSDWAELHELENFEKGFAPDEGAIGTVTVRGHHGRLPCILCGVQLSCGKHVIYKIDELENLSNKTPFDLARYKVDPSITVVTRLNTPVRIICFDHKGTPHPIIALVDFGDKEWAVHLTSNGKAVDFYDSDHDLFFLE